MPGTNSQEPANNEVEKLFHDILPIIPVVVGQACASLDYYPDWMEFDGLVQRVFLLLIDDDYRVLRSFDHRSEPKTWLYIIVWRYILRRIQEQGRFVNLDELPPDSFTVQPDQEELMLSREREEILQAAADKLTEREQKLFGLWRQGRSRKEISEEMGIKKRSVTVERVALIKKLQRIIGEDYAI